MSPTTFYSLSVETSVLRIYYSEGCQEGLEEVWDLRMDEMI